MNSDREEANDIAHILGVPQRLGEMVRILILNELEIMRIKTGSVTLDFSHMQVKASIKQALPGSHEG